MSSDTPVTVSRDTATYLTLSARSRSAAHVVAPDPDALDALLPEDADAAHLIAAILPRVLNDDEAAEALVDFVWGGDVA